MKTTLDLPADLVKQIKLRAFHEGKKLKDAVAETLRAGLAARSSRNDPSRRATPRRLVQIDRKTGLPIIRGSKDAPGRHMTVQQHLDLEQLSQTREDLERLSIPVR